MLNSLWSRTPGVPALVVGAAVSLMAAAPAFAQDYGPYDDEAYPAGPTEEVIVAAPRPIFPEGQRLNGPLQKVSLTTAVPYNDLDLRTHSGARELRFRVRTAARDVCAQLTEAYPVYQLNGTSCYRGAVENGLVRANAAISDARLSYYYGYGD